MFVNLIFYLFYNLMKPVTAPVELLTYNNMWPERSEHIISGSYNLICVNSLHVSYSHNDLTLKITKKIGFKSSPIAK